MIHAMKGTALPAAAQDRRHDMRMRCPGPMRQEPSFQENAAEERQTEGFLDCHANIVENSASAAIRAEPNRRLAKISLRKNHLETFARRSCSMKQSKQCFRECVRGG